MQREKAKKKRSNKGRCSNNGEKDMQVPESRNIIKWQNENEGKKNRTAERLKKRRKDT